MITKEQMTLPHEALHWWHHLKQVEVRLQLEIKQTNKGINMTKHLEILNVLKEIFTMPWTCLTEHQLLLLNALLFRNNGCQHFWPTIPTTEARLEEMSKSWTKVVKLCPFPKCLTQTAVNVAASNQVNWKAMSGSASSSSLFQHKIACINKGLQVSPVRVPCEFKVILHRLISTLTMSTWLIC